MIVKGMLLLACSVFNISNVDTFNLVLLKCALNMNGNILRPNSICKQLTW